MTDFIQVKAVITKTDTTTATWELNMPTFFKLLKLGVLKQIGWEYCAEHCHVNCMFGLVHGYPEAVTVTVIRDDSKLDKAA